MYKCKECNEELIYVNYNVPITGNEDGTVRIPKNKVEDLESNMDDYETDNSETNWDGSKTYSCPHCGSELELDDIIWEEEEKEEEEEETNPKNIEPEETIFSIIPPGKPIIREENYNENIINSNIICKKCNHVFVLEKIGYEDKNEDNCCECPICNELNSRKEFKELMSKGYFKE